MNVQNVIKEQVPKNVKQKYVGFVAWIAHVEDI